MSTLGLPLFTGPASWPPSRIAVIWLKSPVTLWSSLKSHPMPLVLSYGHASASVSQFSLFKLFILEALLHIKWTREQNAELSTAAETLICNTGQPGSLLLLTLFSLRSETSDRRNKTFSFSLILDINTC